MLKHSSRWLVVTILSLSLLTVMAGAAVAPALGSIRNYFSSASPMTVQLVVSMPALFIILTSLCFPLVCRYMGSRTIALAGLTLYVCASAGAFLCNGIGMLLLLRALLGVAVGLLLPLATGLLAYYFPPARMAQLMGLSAFMNQMGGVIATLLAGMLCAISWRYAFLVYLGGVFAMVLVLVFLPNDHLPRREQGESATALLRRFHAPVTGMLLLMLIFFIFPTHFAITAMGLGLDLPTTTCLMVGLDLVAALAGLCFGAAMKRLGRAVKYISPLCLLAGMACLSMAQGMGLLAAGCVWIGIGNGIGVPYINTIAGLRAGSGATTSVMPMLSAALNAGQFVSPLVVTPLASMLFGAANLHAAYIVGVFFALLFLLQTFATRKF